MTDPTLPDATPGAPATAPADDAPATVPRFCADCGAALVATARFCQACGTPVGGAPVGTVRTGRGADDDQGIDVGPEGPLVTRAKGPAAALPWLLAAVALVGGSVYVAQTEPRTPAGAGAATPGGMVAPFATGGGGGAPPDIANMTPNERANRLYGRIMTFVQAGKADSAAMFAPMALAAHEMLERPSIDERYHLGQINEMLGNAPAAAAQADTMLTAEPENLLGLMLATHAAQLANNAADVKRYNGRFLQVLDTQLATKKPEYEMHRAEIERTAADARR